LGGEKRNTCDNLNLQCQNYDTIKIVVLVILLYTEFIL
jgi:hypothetical protein